MRHTLSLCKLLARHASRLTTIVCAPYDGLAVFLVDGYAFQATFHVFKYTCSSCHIIDLMLFCCRVLHCCIVEGRRAIVGLMKAVRCPDSSSSVLRLFFVFSSSFLYPIFVMS